MSKARDINDLSEHEVEGVQKTCNGFTNKWLRGVAPLKVDGEAGIATERRLRWCKWYVGFGDGADDNTIEVDHRIMEILRDPRAQSLYPGDVNQRKRMAGAGKSRRAAQKRRWATQRARAAVTPGVTTFDGVPCAKWMKPKLQAARDAGRWKGRLVSGWRSRAYSRSLCVRICGAARCPGRCAGESSNHVGNQYPHGAVDVSDYVTFERECARLGLGIRNTLDARDPVHFSVPGN